MQVYVLNASSLNPSMKVSEPLVRAKETIEQVLSGTKAPILAFSGGKDSLLLLHLAERKLPLLIFKDFWPKAHLKWVQGFIEDQGLTAFFYRPSMLKYESGSIISHYSFGASTIPVISDVTHSDECGLDKGRSVMNRTPLASFLWDAVLTGSRATDSHPLVPKLDFTGTNVITPLWDWTDEMVYEAISYLNIEVPRTSTDAECCVNCLAPDRVVYCPKLQRNIDSIGT